MLGASTPYRSPLTPAAPVFGSSLVFNPPKLDFNPSDYAVPSGTPYGGFGASRQQFITAPVPAKSSFLKDMLKDLAAGGLQFLNAKLALQQQKLLQDQGVKTEMTSRPDGTFLLREPPFYKTPLGIAAIVGGGLLVVALVKKR